MNASAPSAPSAPFAPKRKKLLTRPVLKFLKDEPRYIKFEGAIYLGKEMKTAPGDKKKEPAHLANVVDLTTGELAQIIVNAVPMSVLNENYPDESYVGKCFMITRQTRKEGKAYDPFAVEEIEDPATAADEQQKRAESVNAAITGKPAGARRP